MHYNDEIFSWQYPIVKQFLYHYICYKELHLQYQKSNPKSEFWTYTINAHIMQAMICWTKVFGSEGINKTHWKKLSIKPQNDLILSFRKGLTEKLGISEKEWHSYWKSLNDFRSMYIAHTEPDFSEPVPEMDIAVKVAFFYDDWVRAFIKPDVMEESPLKISAEKFSKEVNEIVNNLISKV